VVYAGTGGVSMLRIEVSFLVDVNKIKEYKSS